MSHYQPQPPLQHIELCIERIIKHYPLGKKAWRMDFHATGKVFSGVVNLVLHRNYFTALKLQAGRKILALVDADREHSKIAREFYISRNQYSAIKLKLDFVHIRLLDAHVQSTTFCAKNIPQVGLPATSTYNKRVS